MYYAKACDLNSTGGCFYQAELVDNGIGLERDRIKATIIFSKACDLGLPVACQIVGSRYEQGLTVEQNVLFALAYYDKGCSLIYDEYLRDDPDYGCIDYGRLKYLIDRSMGIK